MNRFFDHDPTQSVDYESLPALVRAGQNRDEIIENIVASWCTTHGIAHDPATPIANAVDRHIAAGGLVVEGVSFWDETAPGETDGRPGAPIDLGDLLRAVEERLRDREAPEEFQQRPDLYILLMNCRVHRFSAEGLLVRPRFISVGVRFDVAYLERAVFGDATRFWGATFGDSARFWFATFGDSARFDRATFGESASFDLATFGESASFEFATFGDEAGFGFAKFADRADFANAKFADRADFANAKFADSANFGGARFGDSAILRGATFGNASKFLGATFGDSTILRGATFGDAAAFLGAKFGGSADFANARFADSADFGFAKFDGWAGFAHATFDGSPDFAHAAFADSADFGLAKFGNSAIFRAAKFGDSANFDAAKFGDSANFDAATFGDSANFDAAKFGDSASFNLATFGNSATFVGATFGNAAEFLSASFSDSASFRGATFGDGASFVRADFSKAALQEADLRGADLRDTRGLVLDATRVRDAHFSPLSDDPWSRLRRAYTGPRLLFNLLLLIAFFLPYVARTGYWVGVNRAQNTSADVLREARGRAEELRPEYPKIADAVESLAHSVERNVPGPDNPDSRRSQVWRVVIGVDRGAWFWVSAVLLLVYNALRAALTMLVAPMRDEEERSGVSPAYRVTGWSSRPREQAEREARGFARLRLRCSSLWWAATTRWTECYGWLIWPHRVVNAIFWLAVASFAWNAWHWLMLDVWLPPATNA